MNSKTHKGFIIPIVIILVLIILAVVAYFFSPKSTNIKISTASLSTSADTTANWQIYKNEEYNFQIKYPNNYFIQDKWTIKKDFGNLKISSEDKQITIEVFFNEKPKSANGSPLTQLEVYSGKNINVTRIEGGYIARDKFITNDQKYYIDLYALNDNGFYWLVRATGSLNDVTLLDQILSTFKFIN